MQENLVASSLARPSSKSYFPETRCDGAPGGGVDLRSLCPFLSILSTCSMYGAPRITWGSSRAVQWIHESKVLELQTMALGGGGSWSRGRARQDSAAETGHIGVLVTNRKRQCLLKLLTAHLKDQRQRKMARFTCSPSNCVYKCVIS